MSAGIFRRCSTEMLTIVQDFGSETSMHRSKGKNKHCKRQCAKVPFYVNMKWGKCFSGYEKMEGRE